MGPSAPDGVRRESWRTRARAEDFRYAFSSRNLLFVSSSFFIFRRVRWSLRAERARMRGVVRFLEKVLESHGGGDGEGGGFGAVGFVRERVRREMEPMDWVCWS
jgi:hypothetical protein